MKVVVSVAPVFFWVLWGFFFFLSKNMLKSLFNSCHTSQVRVNSLVCLGKILEYLDKWFVLDDILPFLQQIPSKEPAVLMGILGNYYFQLYPLLWFDILSLKAFYIVVDKSSHSVSLKWLLKPFCFWFLSMPLFSYLMYYWYTFQTLVHTAAVLSSDYSLLWHFHGLLFSSGEYMICLLLVAAGAFKCYCCLLFHSCISDAINACLQIYWSSLQVLC